MSAGARPGKRRCATAREAAVQALFQVTVAGTSTDRVIEEFLDRPITGKPVSHRPRFRRIVTGTGQSLAELDGTIEPLLGEGWSLRRLDTTLLCVLRCAAWELIHPSRTAPARVVIAEYLKVARGFAEGGELGFVNALLDRIARSARASEFV